MCVPRTSKKIKPQDNTTHTTHTTHTIGEAIIDLSTYQLQTREIERILLMYNQQLKMLYRKYSDLAGKRRQYYHNENSNNSVMNHEGENHETLEKIVNFARGEQVMILWIFSFFVGVHSHPLRCALYLFCATLSTHILSIYFFLVPITHSTHHIISRLIIYPIPSHLIISQHSISYRVISHHITSHHITSYTTTSHHITSRHITSRHITSHHIPCHHITSCPMSSYLITSHHI